MAPCDAASAYARIEYRVPTPRHYATHPGGHHNTVMDLRIWKIQVWLRPEAAKWLRCGAPEPFLMPLAGASPECGLFALSPDRIGGFAVNRVVTDLQRR